MAYRYVPQQYAGTDPRAQTEDLGDDPVKASTYAVANLKRVVPNLVTWITKPGEPYDDLREIYGETVGMWSQYMGHVGNLIGGVHVDFKTADQAGAVFTPLPKARQKEALGFLTANVFMTPGWLAPADITARLGPGTGGTDLAARQANVVNSLLSTSRLNRLQEGAELAGPNAYAVGEFLADVRGAVWGAPGMAAPELDAGRRAMHRVYLERLEALVTPPAPPTGGAGGRGGGPSGPFLAPPNVQRSDFPALARAQLRSIREQAQAAATAAAAGIARAHWQDIVDRIDGILDPKS
jgi:hypothetical protein